MKRWLRRRRSTVDESVTHVLKMTNLIAAMFYRSRATGLHCCLVPRLSKPLSDVAQILPVHDAGVSVAIIEQSTMWCVSSSLCHAMFISESL